MTSCWWRASADQLDALFLCPAHAAQEPGAAAAPRHDHPPADAGVEHPGVVPRDRNAAEELDLGAGPARSTLAVPGRVTAPDRQTRRFVGDGNGRVKAIETVGIEWVSENGRFAPREVPGTEKTWPATLVLLALGFLGPEKGGMLEQLGVKLDARGNVETGPDKRTDVPGVFAAGDMRRGQSLVVWAIAEGRQAAESVGRYLKANGGG